MKLWTVINTGATLLLEFITIWFCGTHFHIDWIMLTRNDHTEIQWNRNTNIINRNIKSSSSKFAISTSIRTEWIKSQKHEHKLFTFSSWIQLENVHIQLCSKFELASVHGRLILCVHWLKTEETALSFDSFKACIMFSHVCSSTVKRISQFEQHED